MQERVKNLHKIVRITVIFLRQQILALLDRGASASFISVQKFPTLNNNIILNENVTAKLESLCIFMHVHHKIAIKLFPECKLQHSFCVLP